MIKRKRRSYTGEFKLEAVRLVSEQGYSLAEAARNLGMHANLLASWLANLWLMTYFPRIQRPDRDAQVNESCPQDSLPPRQFDAD